MKYIGLVIFILIIALIIWGVFFRIQDERVAIDQKISSQRGDEEVSQEIQIPEGSTVVLETSMGSVRIAFDVKAAPQTVQNFVKLVEQGFYDGLSFHRVIPGFVVQGGDPLGDGTGGPGYTVPAEINLLHKRGAVAMARQPDQVNPKRASSGSQFYIALQDLPTLDGQYTVFGQVVEGMEVIDEIAKVQTNVQDRPVKDVIIEKASVINEQQ